MCAQNPKKGGDTEFADLRATYDKLCDELKMIVDGIIAEHHVFHSRISLGLKYTSEEIAAAPPSYWPLIRNRPTTKRKVVFPPVIFDLLKVCQTLRRGS